MKHKFKAGDYVHYIGFEGDEPQNRRINSIQDENHAFVVFHCAGEWDSGYVNYTGQRTEIKDLYPGWK